MTNVTYFNPQHHRVASDTKKGRQLTSKNYSRSTGAAYQHSSTKQQQRYLKQQHNNNRHITPNPYCALCKGDSN